MNQNKNYKFIDLFAGAGGLSEGFIRAGFEPIAHIEMDHYACDTLKTRAAYHYLKANNKLSIYEQYLRTKKEKTDGAWLWNQVPKEVIDTVIQEAIGTNGKTNCSIFKKHFVPGLPLLTQNKMCILLQKIEATYSVASIFALNLRKRSMVG